MADIWRSFPERLRYLVVGMLNTAVGYGMFGIFFLTFNGLVPYLVLLLMAHFAAVTFSFLTHRHWVFGGKAGEAWSEYFRFQGSYLWLMPQSLLMNWCMVQVFGWNPWLAQGITMAFGIVTAFALHRILVFHKAH